jgi:hypothetical protein
MVAKSVVACTSLRVRRRQERKLVTLTCLLIFCAPVMAQTPTNRESQASTEQKQSDKIREANLLEAERRTFAISSVTSLANEARSYDDLTLRTRVLARVADTLWEVDEATARSLFRKAWEAAEEADAQETRPRTKGNPPSIVLGLKRISGRDLRLEVLTLAARCDRAFGEEFLAKLKDETRRAAESDAGKRSADPWLTSEQVSKRLLLARELIADGQIESGLEIAAPVLNEVNAQSINFLSALREKRPEVADQRFAVLLRRAELDPLSDANTVSGLSSYVFTPGLYVTFSPDGGSRWTQPEGNGAAPNLPATLRSRFFQTASTILLRPVPPPDQDFSTAGRLGKYMVVKRLLPFFDQEAPETAAMLRSQLTILASDLPRTAIREDNSRFIQGLNPEAKADDPMEKMQERLDRAGSARERDEIYADAAVVLAHQGNARAKDLADKIEDSARRSQIHQYVDLQLVQVAISKKEASEIVRLAKAGQLTHTQRVWAYTQAAKILKDSERVRAAELLAEAAEEARRIYADDHDRARSLVAVATGFVTIDQVRAWELLGEAVKAANSVETFTGENEQLTFGLLATRTGIKTMSVTAADFSLTGLINALTEVDLTRTTDLAKSFKNAAPRATAILAIAHAVLNTKTSGSPPKEKKHDDN